MIKGQELILLPFAQTSELKYGYNFLSKFNRVGTDHNRKFTRFENIFQLVIIEHQHIFCDGKRYCLFFAGAKVICLKPFSSLTGRTTSA